MRYSPLMKTKNLKIGIQGVRASFHDVAAHEYFSDFEIEAVAFSSFRGLCQALKLGEVDFILMAIENSIAGSILPNYSLLERFELKVIGEVYQRIIMNLMALPGQRMRDLQFAQSHPMALLQCEDFLAKHAYLKIIEAADTAESAKDIQVKNLVGYGAIASELAAQAYDLEILERSIETNKANYTRFLAVGRDSSKNKMADKASLRFEISHQPGSLLAILASFQNFGLNMTKLQSVPIIGRPYEYSFHVDIEWQDTVQYQKAMLELESKTINLIHLGEYQKSQKPVF
jgi:prephenate dehydratase